MPVRLPFQKHTILNQLLQGDGVLSPSSHRTTNNLVEQQQQCYAPQRYLLLKMGTHLTSPTYLGMFQPQILGIYVSSGWNPAGLPYHHHFPRLEDGISFQKGTSTCQTVGFPLGRVPMRRFGPFFFLRLRSALFLCRGDAEPQVRMQEHPSRRAYPTARFLRFI